MCFCGPGATSPAFGFLNEPQKGCNCLRFKCALLFAAAAPRHSPSVVFRGRLPLVCVSHAQRPACAVRSRWAGLCYRRWRWGGEHIDFLL